MNSPTLERQRDIQCNLLFGVLCGWRQTESSIISLFIWELRTDFCQHLAPSNISPERHESCYVSQPCIGHLSQVPLPCTGYTCRSTSISRASIIQARTRFF